MSDKRVGIIKKILPIQQRGNIVYTDNGIEKSIIFYRQNKIRYIVGDLVEFDIEKIEYNGNNFLVANNLLFIENSKLNNIINNHYFEKIYVGFLKKYNDKYYVKERESYIQFPVINLSPEFIFPDENSYVEFLLEGKKEREMKAVILNLEKSEDFRLFREKEIHKAVVTDINKDWIYVKVENFNISGRIYIKNREITYEEGEYIFVIYAGVSKKNHINFITVL